MWILPGFSLILVILFGLLFYILLLDHRVRGEFEGKRWTLPARVYAQATEIYIGQNISLQNIEKELLELGYEKTSQLNSPGRFHRKSPNVLEITSRMFEFWDGTEPEEELLIEFENDTISLILDKSSNKNIPFLRLEPRLIGKIYPEHNEDRVLVDYESVPQSLVDALIAIEDHNFYMHFGIDPRGILRAMWNNLKKGSFSQGGSTLTQQLVKNFYLTHEKTMSRKLNELVMSLLLEYHYSKREILSAYINEVYLGQDRARGIHGFGTAAEFYFSKPIQELNVSEIALLVGLVKGASYYNPRKHPERATRRRNLVISEMLALGRLNENEAKRARERPLDISQKPDWSGGRYSAFIELLRYQLRDYYQSDELKTEGLRIFTTLNADFQNHAQEIVKKRLSQLEKVKKLEKNSLQAAIVLTSTDTGEVLAVIGSRSALEPGFNRALDAKRPIGSLIKPAVYLAAMAQPEKFNPITLIEDAEINLSQKNGETWQPENYDKKLHGAVPLYKALASSYNLASVNLGLQLGLDTVIDTLHKLGVKQRIRPYPSLLLGAFELTPLEVTQMYQTLASSGFQVPLNTIREVLDKNGQPLQRKELKVHKTLDDKAVYINHALLTEVFKQGTASGLNQGLQNKLPLAGKTGTTNDLRDSWFAGYGANFLAVAWVGRDDNQSAGLTGASGAMQIWGDVMRQLPLEALNLVTPEGIVWRKVRSIEGDCLAKLRFPFMASHVPESSQLCH